MSKYKEQALALARAGFRVFPCKPGSKLPGIKKWPTLATTDEEQIGKWWTGYYSMANIGIATGDDVVILDLDIQKTSDDQPQPANQSLTQLKAMGLPPTYTIRTASGGLHLYYKTPRHPDTGAPAQIKTCAAWMPGVDIRGYGGQGVGPGSIITGKQTPYTVLKDLPIAELPENITAKLPRRTNNQPTQQDLSHIPEHLKTRVAAQASADLITDNGANEYNDFPDAVPLGKHDEMLFKYACSWRTRGLTLSQAEVLMKELTTRLEHDPSEPNPVEAGMAKGLEKLHHAYESYGRDQPKPENTWTQVVAPGQVEVQARRREVADMKAALERFVLVEAGNRVADLQRTPRHAVLALEEFKNSYKNVYVGEKSLPVQWLGNIHRQTVRDVVWYPSNERIVEDENEQMYNTFTAATFPEIDSTKDVAEQIAPFIEHIRYMFPEKDEARLFIDWMAFTVQRPAVRVQWMPLIVSKPGIGKGLIYRTMQQLLGVHNTSMIGPKDADPSKSQFNSYMAETLLVCMDELYTQQKWDTMEYLKTLVTENTIEINHKYGQKRQERIFCNWLGFTNHDDAAALKDDDRRFWVHKVSAQRREPGYYKRLVAWIDSDGPAYLRQFLLQWDVSRFDPGEAPPETAAKRVMVNASRSDVEQILLDAMADREGAFKFDVIDPTIAESIVRSALGVDKLDGRHRRQVQKVMMSHSLMPAQERHRVQIDENGPGQRYRLRAIRNHSQWQTMDDELWCQEFANALRAHLGQRTGAPTISHLRTVK